MLGFATSGTFLALLVFGTALIGTMLLAEIGWLVEGWRLPGAAYLKVAAGVVLLPARSPVRWLYGLVGVPDRHWRVEPQ
ncbi:hypothetical protein OG765_35665 [Streptomyces sp. NBC_00555]|uniref:hypothetical protein n=1 Tax=Streptomyces sp. NBC_00555 TaxID=2903662 RepID=UPI0022509188|nr:hypothetical protein [Streptomyces sp. NBC_00555]MCX5016265.1 hypothetical protein [Streptomyces sp. NBC_00555]